MWNKRQAIVFPGQRIITAGGQVAVVAFERNGIPHVYSPTGVKPAVVCGDAFGGEYDQALMNVA